MVQPGSCGSPRWRLATGGSGLVPRAEKRSGLELIRWGRGTGEGMATAWRGEAEVAGSGREGGGDSGQRARSCEHGRCRTLHRRPGQQGRAPFVSWQRRKTNEGGREIRGGKRGKQGRGKKEAGGDSSAVFAGDDWRRGRGQGRRSCGRPDFSRRQGRQRPGGAGCQRVTRVEVVEAMAG